MLPEELVDLVSKTVHQKAETQTLELKAAHVDCPKRLYDTLSSFSNQASGGILLFGIDEAKSFEVVGVYDLQSLQKKVTEQCNQMEPPVRAVFTVAEVDGKPVCSAEIPAIDLLERPCYYKGAGRVKGSYIRVGDADLPMTDYELYSYEAFRKHLYNDERSIERASLKVLNQDVLQRYVLEKRIDRPGFGKLSEPEQYKLLNITRNGTPTLAAVLNFAIYPQGYLPQLGITAIVVPGTEIGSLAEDSARFLDNKRIEAQNIVILLAIHRNIFDKIDQVTNRLCPCARAFAQLRQTCLQRCKNTVKYLLVVRVDQAAKRLKCDRHIVGFEVAALTDPCGEQIFIGDEVADILPNGIHRFGIVFGQIR